MNTVLFGDFERDPDFTRYPGAPGAYTRRPTIVGVTSAGLLYVDRKIPRLRGYDFPAKLLAWEDTSRVRIRSCIGLKGLIGGLLLLCYAALTLYGWIGGGTTGIAIVISIACGFGGLVLTVGARRNRIEVHDGRRWLRWLSPALGYRATLLLCEELVEYCRRNNVPCEAHVQGGICCHHCGYYLIGNTSGICPECGKEDERVRRRAEHEAQSAVSIGTLHRLNRHIDTAAGKVRQPVGVVSVVLALTAATLWWLPAIGLLFTIPAIIWNWRILRWTRTASIVGFWLSIIITGSFALLLLLDWARWI